MAKKRIVFKRIGYRLIALAIIVVGIIVVRYYTSPHYDRFVFYVDIPPPLETEIGDRDMSQYDYGGHIANCAVILYGEDDEKKGEECFRMREDARGFIEQHFNNHRRGYVIIDSPSIDHVRTTYFFIEPSETGRHWEIRVTFSQPGPYTRFNRNINTEYYSEIFRRRVHTGLFVVKDGSNALVLRSRGVYELVL